MKSIALITILFFSQAVSATECPNGPVAKGIISVCDGYLISAEVAKGLFQISNETLPNLQKRYSLLEEKLNIDKELIEELKNQVSILKLDTKQLIESKDKIANDYRQTLESQAWKNALFVGVGVAGTILIVIAVGFAVKSFVPQIQSK